VRLIAPVVGSSLVGSVSIIDPFTKKKKAHYVELLQLLPASPKAGEWFKHVDLNSQTYVGSGPDGAVLSKDVLQSPDQKVKDEEEFMAVPLKGKRQNNRRANTTKLPRRSTYINLSLGRHGRSTEADRERNSDYTFWSCQSPQDH